MGKKDGREVAQENEVRVLRALHRFGWLRTRDLGALVWQRWLKASTGEPDFRPPVARTAGVQMAQRTLLRLRKARQVIRSQAPDGSLIYALSEVGARRLQRLGVSSAATGKDKVRSFSSAQFRHRATANEVALGAILGGYRVSTEHEVARGLWIGGEAGIAGKRPDVLIRDHSGHVWWVEVERSRKNAKDYAKLLQWLGKVGTDALSTPTPALLGENLCWAKVIFICTPAFREKLLRDLLDFGWKKFQLDALLCFKTELYRFVDILFS
jgi:broad specificity phosphatase PhoE